MIHAFKSRVAVAVFAASSVFAANAAEITGAGASFIYPVMSKWSADYNAATSNKVNYQSIGSGGGIAQIKAKTVDFGSSDAPLKPEDLAAAGLAQFPSVIGGVVPVVKLNHPERDARENRYCRIRKLLHAKRNACCEG